MKTISLTAALVMLVTAANASTGTNGSPSVVAEAPDMAACVISLDRDAHKLRVTGCTGVGVTAEGVLYPLPGAEITPLR